VTRYPNLALTAAAVVATVLPALLGGARAWWVLPLAVLSSVPVLWRDRALIPVALVVGTATTVSASLGAPPLLPVGPLVCIYTLAARASLPIRLLGTVVTAAGLVLSLFYPRPDVEVLRYLAVAYVLAYALGTGGRVRRTQAMALAERAEAAVLRERTRIARDMHDILAHAVGVMVVQAEAGPLLIRADPGRATAAVAAIATTGREAVVQLRRAVGSLREPADGPLDQPGLAQLPALVDRVRDTGLDARLAVSGTPVTPPADVGVAAYRIVQEALTNVVRHAQARSVRVGLDYAARSLTVSVTDDGRGAARPGPSGFGRGATWPGHGREATWPGYGIGGMRERAQSCGGTLRTGAGSGGRGFSVSAVLPVSA
jgi:signal transduction histidine kinase